MIPRNLFRTVPEETSDEVEGFWACAQKLHPEWTTYTLRDPIDPAGYPRSTALHDRCASGAQYAGLVRLEALINHGGVYIDSDFECYRSLEALRGLRGFAAWEDEHTVPDAVLGAEAGHPALEECWRLAVDLLERGAWASGPGVTTVVLPRWPDFVLLPPGAFYPYHYTERGRRFEDHATNAPWAFGAHHWAGSWLTGGDLS